jgi:gluconolactonase
VEAALRFETWAGGFALVEGPTDDGAGGLYFSDVLGGGVHHLDADGRVEQVVPKRRGVGGLALHADGGLVLSGRDLVHVKDGATRTLLSVPGAAGWNDLCTDAAGRVYAGSLRFAVFDPEAEEVPGECWRLDPGGSAEALYDGVVHANGIGVSPDARRLWHSDTRRGVLVLHDLDADGRVAGRREIPVPGEGRPDGLAFDALGCAWVASAGGGRLDRFAPDGGLLGSVAVPARVVTSVCFGGADRRDLIVVSADHAEEPARRGSIFRARSETPGAPVFPARV